MSFIEARRKITQRTPSGTSGEDAYGNPIPTWVEADRMVYGWRNASSSEPGDVLDGRLVADVVLTAPTFEVSAQDEFTVPGYRRNLTLEGEPIVADYGPFDFKPGMRLNLKFVEQ